LNLREVDFAVKRKGVDMKLTYLALLLVCCVGCGKPKPTQPTVPDSQVDRWAATASRGPVTVNGSRMTYPVTSGQRAEYGKVHAQSSPMDVPPVEKKVMHNPMAMQDVPPLGGIQCMECPYEVIERSCANKSRFLLQSEDGKYHCLRLGQP